ncbi:MAG: tetratricopeptide repeat protein [Gemmatimonadetes bacterium]|nr:tetratricopeptide repeat protein [Gemmatimonadota bacterium]
MISLVGACRDSGEAGPGTSEPDRIPQPVVETDPEGGRIAKLDLPAIQRWCDEAKLPEPPNVHECEPGIAESLTVALARAAEKRDGDSYGLAGRICYVLQDMRAARDYLALAERAAPKDSRWPYYLGVIAQDSGESSKAIERLNAALALNPKLAIAHARLGQLYFDAGDLDAARRHAETYARMTPRDSFGFVLLGRVSMERGAESDALQYFETATQKIPKDFQAHHYLGQAYARLGRREDASREFDIVARLPKGGNWLNPRDPLWAESLDLAHSSAGLIRRLEPLLSTQRWDEMAKLMERIIALRAGDFKMMSNLADVYRKMGRYQDAHQMLDRAQRIAPTSSELYAKRAALLLAENRFDDAIAAADKALADGGAEIQPWAVKARALFVLDRFDEAEAPLRKVLALAPSDAQSWYLLGVTLHRLSRPSEAADCFRRVQSLATTPGDPLFESATQSLKSLDMSEKSG